MEMRKNCRCGSIYGEIRTKSGQDCVYCLDCGRFCYNAPRIETGRKIRSVQTTHEAIKPNVRSRIICRANMRCERCGKPADQTTCGLQVGHILSVLDGHEFGISDAQLNADENLIAECDECNLGHGSESLPLWLAVAIISARTRTGV